MVQIIQIDRLEGPDLEIFSKLSEPELYHYREPDKGLFIAESPNVIDRALDAGYQPVSMLIDTKEIAKNAAHILERIGNHPDETIPVFTVLSYTITHVSILGIVFSLVMVNGLARRGSTPL